MPDFPKIARLCLILLLVAAGNTALSQVKGESGLKWYSWNASGGIMMPVDPFNTMIAQGTKHIYQFSGTPGFTFSLSKPVTLQLNLGAELEDHLIDGKLDYTNTLDASQLYNSRLRTYSFFAQYYLFPGTNINFFFLAKAGRSGINRATGNEDLSRTIPADLWEWVFTGGYGVTFHLDSHFSVNLYGEYSPVPITYLKDLKGLTTSLSNPDKKTLPMARIVLSVTGNSDVRIYYPLIRGRIFGNKYRNNGDKYRPYYRERKR